jgi:ubiquinone/menaquinone biosynthesis C-methylase UbiE
MVWLWVILGLVLLAVLIYWQLIIAEGAYLGRRVVTYLYDVYAHTYDNIKGFDAYYEQSFLGLPLSRSLSMVPDPLVLDVATGTARLPRALLGKTGFHGRIIGVDLSRKMLGQAVRRTAPWNNQITFIWQDASHLPFPDATFDAVACMEALEFMPDPLGVLTELVRVLRPGGTLLTSNRIGPDARFMPGRTFSSHEFEAHLRALPLEMIRTQPWQVDYDLIWAVKQGVSGPRGMRRLEEILRCPRCGAVMQCAKTGEEREVFTCENGHTYPVAQDGIIELA